MQDLYGNKTLRKVQGGKRFKGKGRVHICAYCVRPGGGDSLYGGSMTAQEAHDKKMAERSGRSKSWYGILIMRTDRLCLGQRRSRHAGSAKFTPLFKSNNEGKHKTLKIGVSA